MTSSSYETAPRILSFEGPTKLGRGRRLQAHPTTTAVVGAAAAGAGGDMLSETSSVEGYSSSPYPLLDAFITSCVDKGGVRGAIRRWSYFQQGLLADSLVPNQHKHAFTVCECVW